MLGRKLVLALGFMAGVYHSTARAVSFTEDFSADPSNTWSFGIGNNSFNQFSWTNAAARYSNDAPGELDVHLDSSLPTARFQRSLGCTLTDTNDYVLTTRFSFTVTSAPADQDMQIAFGLVNSNLTGGNRTGSPGIYTDDDTFNSVEFDYFPNANPWDPTLTPAVFGAQLPDDDAFANFTALFGNDSNLGTHTNGITSLPQAVTLQATMIYNAATKLLKLTIYMVNADGFLSPLDTTEPPLNLSAPGQYSQYYTNAPFNVDSLAIMAYHDGFTTADDPSLVADLTFQRFTFSTEIPQPPAVSIQLVDTNVVLTFATISNYLYEVQSTTNVAAGNWSTLASNIVGTGDLAVTTDFDGATAPARFYRVGLTVQ